MQKEANIIILLLALLLVFFLINKYDITGDITGFTSHTNQTSSSATLIIFYPKENAIVESNTITVLAKVRNADIAYTKINNEEFTAEFINSLNFAKTFNLTEGINTISLYVCRDSNCSATKTLTVNYTKKIVAEQSSNLTANLTINNTIINSNPIANPDINNGSTAVIQDTQKTKTNFLETAFRLFLRIFGIEY